MTELVHAPVVLWKLPPLWGLPSPSPFAVKLETWFRMAGVAYTSRALTRPPQSRTGKIPYIELPSGELVADSGHIIERLSRERGIDLDEHLTDHQRAIGHSARRMIEDHLYFHGLYHRWVADPGFEKVSAADGYFRALSTPARFLLSRFLRRNLVRTAWAQGVSRLTDDQRASAAAQDLHALSTLLGDQEFLLGQPSSVDATAFAFAWGVVQAPYASPVADSFAAHTNLAAYVERMKARYWSDWNSGGL